MLNIEDKQPSLLNRWLKMCDNTKRLNVYRAENCIMHMKANHDTGVVELIQLEVVILITKNARSVMRPHKRCAFCEDVISRRDHVDPVQVFEKDLRLDESGQDVSGIPFIRHLLELHDSLLKQLLHVHVPQLNVSRVRCSSDRRSWLLLEPRTLCTKASFLQTDAKVLSKNQPGT